MARVQRIYMYVHTCLLVYLCTFFILFQLPSNALLLNKSRKGSCRESQGC